VRVTLAGVAKSHGAHPVLRDVTLSIDSGARLGVVGPNGVGKSTLLRLIAGLDAPDAGSVTRAPDAIAVGYLPQEPDARPDETLLGYLSRRTGMAAAERELERWAAALATDEHAADAYAAALERFLRLGAADLEWRASTTCAELGLPVELERPMRHLSGGERARAALAAILLARFDVFLLDEPTNDLDLDGLARLERWVDGLEGALVVVSHDRAFLDRTVVRVADIDPHAHRVREWAGGWSAYAEARAAERQRAWAAFEQAAARRRELRRLLAQRHTEARGRGDSLGRKTGGADRRATHALTAKVRQAERLLERAPAAEKPVEPWELRLTLRAGERPGDLVAALQGAEARRGGFRLGPLDVDVLPGERLLVSGRNGSGKTTLLGMLTGDVPLAAGRRVVGPRTVVGTLEQARAGGEASLLEAFPARAGLTPEQARTLLAKFGLAADHVRRPERSLSPGERTRARLAELQARGVNLLVLDEPTNHLDLEAIEQLEAALAGFDGSLVLVSHDRRFVEAVAPTRELAL
jgi:ATPase subunit of ABC transporter with duplicated ATPase domains